MNRLIQAIETTTNKTVRTDNGALTNRSSLNACLDFFFVGPVAKKNPKDAVRLFQLAYVADKETALRVLQWVRDVRGGAGARQAFRDCFAWLMDNHPREAIAILNNTSEIGRWDDLLVALFSKEDKVAKHAVKLIKAGLSNPDTSGLTAKWLPRKGLLAAALRTALGMAPKEYRKRLVMLSNTVETKMCAREWKSIDYSKVPSVATARYRTAFQRHDPAGYERFIGSVEKGQVKINATAVYPHDVLKNISQARHSETVSRAVDAQWAALPNYLEGTEDTGLVVADVSGSMGMQVAGSSTAMDICISLAMYMAERARGPFKDTFITFTTTPQLQTLTGKSVVDRYDQLHRAKWDGSTNLEGVFKLILNTAVKANVPAKDMPTTITIISDMEFNCVDGGRNQTLYDNMKVRYEAAGYRLPRIVFWNVNGRQNNNPVTKHDANTALISGYSPAILATVFNTDVEKFDPVNVMLEAVNIDRYKLKYSR